MSDALSRSNWYLVRHFIPSLHRLTGWTALKRTSLSGQRLYSNYAIELGLALPVLDTLHCAAAEDAGCKRLCQDTCSGGATDRTGLTKAF